QCAHCLNTTTRFNGHGDQFISQHLISTNAARLTGLSKSQCVTQTCQCRSNTPVGEGYRDNQAIKKGNHFLPCWCYCLHFLRLCIIVVHETSPIPHFIACPRGPSIMETH